MMNKERIMLVPKSEKYAPHTLRLLHAEFRIGFLDVEVSCIQSRALGLTVQQRANASRVMPDMLKRWLCVVNIGRRGWCFFATDDVAQAKVMFKDVVQKLKYGETIEVKDTAFRNKPMRISHRGIEFLW